MTDNAPKTGGEVKERTRTETKEPSMWKVVLLNDDYTPFDVAETRVAATEQLAETAGYPLKAVMEEE
jgi:ATP-dependent Clp protease adapter protein ClpS